MEMDYRENTNEAKLFLLVDRGFFCVLIPPNLCHYLSLLLYMYIRYPLYGVFLSGRPCLPLVYFVLCWVSKRKRKGFPTGTKARITMLCVCL